jgi:hypothetical protein
LIMSNFTIPDEVLREAGLSESEAVVDNGDNRVQKKSKNVANLQDRIKLKNLKNSGRLWNSPTTGFWMELHCENAADHVLVDIDAEC